MTLDYLLPLRNKQGASQEKNSNERMGLDAIQIVDLFQEKSVPQIQPNNDHAIQKDGRT